LVIGNNTLRGTPLYDAGLDIDDKIETIDNQPIKSQSDLNKLLDSHHPGDKLSIGFGHREEKKTATILLQENPAVTIVTFEKAGLPVTPAILQFRKSWLGAK
jgi:predicted metalloprotease with PDZ domain